MQLVKAVEYICTPAWVTLKRWGPERQTKMKSSHMVMCVHTTAHTENKTHFTNARKNYEINFGHTENGCL